MNHLIRFLTVLAVTAAVTVPAAAADDLAAVEKKIIAAWEKHTSMTAKMTMESKMTMPTGTIETASKGTYEVVMKDKKANQPLSRMEMTSKSVTKMGDQEMVSKQTSLMINDGRFVYMLMDSDGRKMATKSKADPKQSPDPKSMFELLRKDYVLSLMDDEELNGEKVYVIQITPKDKDQAAGPASMVSKMVMYYRQKDPFVVKHVTYGRDGKPMGTATYSDIKFDVAIDPKRFVFVAPPGVEVMEMPSARPAPSTP